MSSVLLVQLPFPSLSSPHPLLARYYQSYSDKFASCIPGYRIPDRALWEMPIWVAHLAGMLREIGWHARFLDLSREAPDQETCAARIAAECAEPAILFFSPLAQNLDLACGVSRALRQQGHLCVIGGNMAPLLDGSDVATVYRGVLDPERLAALLHGIASRSVHEAPPARRGRVSWVPDYGILRDYHGRVPLLRLNASHGCSYSCSFCGDAWSQKLFVVERAALEAEVRQLEELFPDTRLIYVGDKTFGLSREAMANLLAVFASRPSYRFIVQTHILRVDDDLVSAMRALGVVAVEIGFESADPELLRRSGKTTLDQHRFERALDTIRSAGMQVILNVLGSLPEERPSSHEATVRAIAEWGDKVFLYNLYNFVPYPLTPYFPVLRPRIFNWNFLDWREDSPPVFAPFHQSPEESWSRFLDKIEVAREAIAHTPSARQPMSLAR